MPGESFCPRVVEWKEDENDVAGNTFRATRSEFWPYVSKDSADQCVDLGRSAVRDILDFSRDFGKEGTLRLATSIAIQEPPLLGSELANFIAGAQRQLEASEELL